MIQRLHLKNFELPSPLSAWDARGVFSLQTCQRHLMIGLGELPTPHLGEGPREVVERRGEQAYHYLLEVVCGIQSRVPAESEIVQQFKRAYEQYLQRPCRQKDLMRILEKLLQDAKRVRTQYLEGVGQKTYAAITRKLVLQWTEWPPKRILVVGSGQLAQDVINQLRKRVPQVFITARNGQRVQEFCQHHTVLPLQWRDYDLYREFPVIINTVGKQGVVLFGPDFFYPWQALHPHPLFVDLGRPSSIETDLGRDQGVIGLDYVFEQSAIRERDKRQKIRQAQQAIGAMSRRRGQHLLSPGPQLA